MDGEFERDGMLGCMGLSTRGLQKMPYNCEKQEYFPIFPPAARNALFFIGTILTSNA